MDRDYAKLDFLGTSQGLFIPSTVGHARVSTALLGPGQKEFYVGEEAQTKWGILSLNYGIEHSTVTCWKDMEKILWHVYNCERRINSERPTVPPLNLSLHNCEKMAELLFEEFEKPAIHNTYQATLAFYKSGIVLDTGDGVTHAMPIYNGYYIPYAVSRFNVAGRDITEYLMRLLVGRGYFCFSTIEWEIVRDIKERHCYMALNPVDEQKDCNKEVVVQCKLPDGNIINIGNQCLRAPEILFSPGHIGV